MKKEFIGFYSPTELEINNAWENGIFAFDANTLLNLYRYTQKTRSDFLSALQTIKPKLFLPYQAAYEFHDNRYRVIETVESSYANLKTIIETNFEKNLEGQLNQFKKHPSIEIDSFSKLHIEFVKKATHELEKQKKNHPDFKLQDDVLTQITDLFDGAVGKGFTKEELRKIFDEGKVRYSELIPPGFKDLENKKKRGDRHVYGDLIIWKELINNSIQNKKPVVFITDDRKEDWWTIENGKTIRPREDLIKEFYDLTGIRILIYNADQFLLFAKEKNLVPELNDKTIEEVKEIRISDEITSYNERLVDYMKRIINKDSLNLQKNQLPDSWQASDNENLVKNIHEYLEKSNDYADPLNKLRERINALNRVSDPLQDVKNRINTINNLQLLNNISKHGNDEKL